MSKREISVTITFNEDDLQSMLDGVWWTNEDDVIQPTANLHDLTVKQFGRLVSIIQDSESELRDELMAGMEEAVANGWLDELVEELKETA